MTDLAKTIDEKLAAITDREIKVNAAIAAQTHPQVLSGIVEIALKLEEAKTARNRFKRLPQPPVNDPERLATLNAQIAMAEHRVEQLKKQRDQLTGEDSHAKKYSKLQHSVTIKGESLREHVKSWTPLFRQHDLKPIEIFPELEDYV